jgi:hypothetical protein
MRSRELTSTPDVTGRYRQPWLNVRDVCQPYVPLQFVIWAFTLILTTLVELTLPRSSPPASQCYVDCKASAVPFHRPSTGRWSCRFRPQLTRLWQRRAICGLPAYVYCRLQSVINAAARSIFRLRRSDHVSPALVELHWLSAADRVTLKVAALVYTAVCMTPQCDICRRCRILSPMLAPDVGSCRLTLKSCSRRVLTWSLRVIARFTSPGR